MWIGKRSWIALLNSIKFLIGANGGHALLILFNLGSIFVKYWL
ncbi:putative membrane protein [Helicobacter pylori Hp P-41]|nr:putative membrane protein [Helicobacter pylori Hp P-41]